MLRQSRASFYLWEMTAYSLYHSLLNLEPYTMCQYQTSIILLLWVITIQDSHRRIIMIHGALLFCQAARSLAVLLIWIWWLKHSTWDFKTKHLYISDLSAHLLINQLAFIIAVLVELFHCIFYALPLSSMTVFTKSCDHRFDLPTHCANWGKLVCITATWALVCGSVYPSFENKNMVKTNNVYRNSKCQMVRRRFK